MGQKQINLGEPFLLFNQVCLQILHLMMKDGYRSPSLTVDIAVVRKLEKFQILLIHRGHPPFKGKMAFPGGFVDYNEVRLID